METLLMVILLLAALGMFIRTLGLKKVVIEFDDNDKPPKQLNR